jgi:POT family proton-dependent oligopeptide transporter
MNLLKNHPRGLKFMFFTEMWERIGFYTLMPMLTLYMIHKMHWSEARAGEYYGNFIMACYLFTLLGGWLGDRILKYFFEAGGIPLHTYCYAVFCWRS